MTSTAAELIKAQDENSLELQRTITNIQKCPHERRTVKHFEQAIAKIQQLWDRINKFNNKIRNDTTIDASNIYYTSNLYEKLGEMFNGTINKLEEDLKDARAKTTKDAAKQNMPLKLKRSIVALKEMLSQLLSEDEDRSEEYYATKIAAAEHNWTMINQLHDKFWATENEEYDVQEFFNHENEIANSILALKSRIKAPLKHNEQHTSSIKLPTIDLPSFNGSYLEWREYRDLFRELVDNQPLSGCQKLWYLKTSVTGEAARLIQHVTITSDNYDMAWQTLCQRFENKRLIVSSLLQRLLSQQATQTNSSSTVKSLHDTTTECLLSLRTLGIQTDAWDAILLHVLTQQLDRQTHTLWEQSITNPREIPKVDEFLKFLELRFQSMEVLGATKKPQQQTSNALVTTSSGCPVCKQEHAIYQCAKFLSMAVAPKFKLVQSMKLCLNCLKIGHNYKNCPSKRRCQKCNRPHNTLLHKDKPYKSNQGTQKNGLANNLKSEPQVYKQNPEEATSLAVLPIAKATSVLLSTVVLRVKNEYGKLIQCRAVLDNGSQVNLITNSFA